MDDDRLAKYLTYVAANVRRLRAKHDMTQEALAEAANITLRHLAEIERAKTSVSLGALVAIAEALGVTPRDLLKPAEMPEVKRGRPRKKAEG
ncbi:MAG: helix-turn-helix transcriptional regulator [Minicystis sp.]